MPFAIQLALEGFKSRSWIEFTRMYQARCNAAAADCSEMLALRRGAASSRALPQPVDFRVTYPDVFPMLHLRYVCGAVAELAARMDKNGRAAPAVARGGIATLPFELVDTDTEDGSPAGADFLSLSPP